MCNISLIGTLMPQRKLSFAMSIGLIAAASAMNANVRRPWGVPLALTIISAMAFLGLSITSASITVDRYYEA